MKLTRSSADFISSFRNRYFTVQSLKKNDGAIPCYATRWTVNDNFDTEKQIEEYIEHARREHSKGFEIFSVTEMDAHHKPWLKVIKEKFWDQHGARIMETKSRYHGNYLCWMIMVPNKEVK